LHYGTLLGTRACVRMAAAAWATGFLNALLHTANTFSIPLCQGNVVDQFFCEVPQILKLSCSHSYLREVGLIVLSLGLALGCFVFIVLSYVQIFRAVLRMPSEQGRHKAFSMCLPHLAVVSLFVSTSFFAYLKPPSMSSPVLDLVVAVLYSVVPPQHKPHLSDPEALCISTCHCVRGDLPGSMSVIKGDLLSTVPEGWAPLPKLVPRMHSGNCTLQSPVAVMGFA
ncbi:olfactory receptor 14A16-like, partial [Struthio camelus]|uniref:olfactory receptor 14A16-like n=1 Tax=Struthio camelus TaxID=8801 RepID=UPI003603F8C2